MSRDYITGNTRLSGGPAPGTGDVDVQMAENTDLIFGDNEVLKFGDDFDIGIKWDASNLTILPLTDLTGAVIIGNGTLSMDLKVIGTVAANYLEFDASEDRLNLVIATRTITGEDHALDISYAGVCAAGGGDAMVGVNVAMAPTGTGASWVSAFFGKVTEVAAAGGPVSGYFCGAEFEVNITGQQPSAWAVLVLNSNADNSTYGQNEAYIWLREYGSKAVRSFVEFKDHSRVSASDSVIVSQMPQTPFDTAIRCAIGAAGTTGLWLYGSTVGPASIANFKWIGTGSTKYLEVDATNDRVNMALMGFKWTNAAFTGKCLDFTDVNLAAGSTNNIFSFGDSTTKSVTITDYWLPFRMNITSIANPSAGERLAALMFLKFYVATADQANLDVQGIGLTMEAAFNVGYLHGLDIGISLTDDLSVNTGSVIAGKFTISRTTAKTITGNTGESLAAIQAIITGNGVSTGWGSDGGEQGAVIEAKVMSSADVTSVVWLNMLNGTSATHAFTVGNANGGLITNLFWFPNAGPANCVTVGAACNSDGVDSDGAIRILVGATEYFIPFYTAGNTSGSW